MNKNTSILYWVVAWLSFSFIGFTDSVYMTVVHFKGTLPVCTVMEGCGEVAMSSYAMIGPVPVALLGVVFYTLLIITGVLWLDTRKSTQFFYTPYITVPAFGFTLWLVYLMIFIIEALCIYCLISALSTTLLMLISFRLKLADSRYNSLSPTDTQ